MRNEKAIKLIERIMDEDNWTPEAYEALRRGANAIRQQDAMVHCRDCKHWQALENLPDTVRMCAQTNWLIGAQGYCLYGERIDR